MQGVLAGMSRLGTSGILFQRRRAIAAAATLLMTVLPASGETAGARHIIETDEKVEFDGDQVYSTSCTRRLSSDAASRKLAIASAARALVKSREGVTMTGHESVNSGHYQYRVEEELLGIVQPVVVVQEDPKGGVAGDRWCVTIAEKERVIP